MDELTAEQRQLLEHGIDKRCRMLIVSPGRAVQWEADGVQVDPGRWAPLPTGYRVRNTHVSDGQGTLLPTGFVVHFVQHESYRWVEEGLIYPVIQLPVGDLTPARYAG